MKNCLHTRGISFELRKMVLVIASASVFTGPDTVLLDELRVMVNFNEIIDDTKKL